MRGMKDTRISRMPGKWRFMLTEAAVLLGGLLLFADHAFGRERALLLAFIPYLLLCGLIMDWVAQKYGRWSATLSGIMAAATGGGLMAVWAGSGPYLAWASALGAVYALRIGAWLEEPRAQADLLRGMFLRECFAVPVLAALAMLNATDRPLPLAALLVYLVFRGIGLVQSQTKNRSSGSTRLTGFLAVAVASAGLLVLLLVFPAAAGVLGVMGAGVFMLADVLGWKLPELPIDPLNPDVLMREGAPLSTEEALAASGGAPIPPAVWAGLILLAVAAFLVAIYVMRRKVRLDEGPKQTVVRITRKKDDVRRSKREYLPAGGGIRQAYQMLLRGLEEKGWPVHPQETPKEYLIRLEQDLDAVKAEKEELKELVRRYEEVRFGEIREHAAAKGKEVERTKPLISRILSAVRPASAKHDEGHMGPEHR